MLEFTFFDDFALISYLQTQGFNLRFVSRSETEYYRRYCNYKVHCHRSMSWASLVWLDPVHNWAVENIYITHDQIDTFIHYEKLIDDGIYNCSEWNKPLLENNLKEESEFEKEVRYTWIDWRFTCIRMTWDANWFVTSDYQYNMFHCYFLITFC